VPEIRSATTLTAFAASIEGEARLLLLIDAFSAQQGTLQGRTKLAKLDFLLRYPSFFHRALGIRRIETDLPAPRASENTIEQRMVRFRYGPWDPAYFALLGSLLGRGLIEAIPQDRFIGLRTTVNGRELARRIAATEAWAEVADRAYLLKRAFPTQRGTFLKNFVYKYFPEVTQASWGEAL
jgi:hypothetical protein